MAGQMVHLEIPAGDPGKTLEFWSGLFGWQFQQFEGSPTEYHMTRLSDTQGAAVMAAEGGSSPRVYFNVDDVKASAAKVKELGGECEDPSPVPGMGWFATCTDTAGNPFGIWQSDPNAGQG